MKDIYKSYEVIRIYPGSPKLGTILKGRQHPDYMGSVLYCGNGLMYFNLKQEYIENSPDFYREIPPLEYKITLWAHPNNLHSHSLRRVNKSFIPFELLRLKDNLKFRIGERITIGTITSFSCIGGIDNLVYNPTVTVNVGSTQPFNYIKKYEKV